MVKKRLDVSIVESLKLKDMASCPCVQKIEKYSNKDFGVIIVRGVFF